MNWRQKRAFKKSKKFTEDAADGFWELFHLAVTYHGRFYLTQVVKAAEADEIYVEPKVLGLYKYVLMAAPYKVYATIN